MNVADLTRRDFLADSGRAASAGWLAVHLSWLAVLAGCARDDARNDGALVSFTPAEWRAMRALAAQIIPSGDTPGAEEAGAVQFVDRALALPFFASSLPIVRAGLADLDARARAVEPNAEFGTLSVAQQIAIMRRVEHEPFFPVARSLVLIGTFADPSYGGNRNGAGWTIVGMEHRPSYSAPFGWYDAQRGTEPKPAVT